MLVKEITAAEHLAYLKAKPSVSFLQTPAWGKTKTGWQSMSLGWFDGDNQVGAGLVLLRKVPKLNRYLAYLPEGPDLDWANQKLPAALNALVEFLKPKGVFQIKMGPHIWVNRWSAQNLKDAIANGTAKRIGELVPDETNQIGLTLITQLSRLGWKKPAAAQASFGDYQPRFVFQINLKNKTEEEILSGFNQQWRRNIKKAQSEGVIVRKGTESDLEIFHTCYVETAKRDGFTPRPISYFQKMWQSLKAEDDSRIQLFIAQHKDHPGAIAATTLTRVGSHSWYSYGASTTAARDLRPSNAIQWEMIKDSLTANSEIYDLRGISDTLDQDNHLFGLIQFKLGTGGYAQEYVGEWDYVISKAWSKAFNLYMSRR